MSYRIGEHLGAWEDDEMTTGRVESAGFTPEDEIYLRTAEGELTGPWNPDQLHRHADYPHQPGTLYDCRVCEAMGTLDPN